MAMSDLLLRVAIIEKNERGQEVELVRKTMQFKPQTTALEACATIRERLSEIKGLGHPNQYGLFLMDEDPKKGVWLEPGRTLEHYLLRENVSNLIIILDHHMLVMNLTNPSNLSTIHKTLHNLLCYNV